MFSNVQYFNLFDYVLYFRFKIDVHDIPIFKEDGMKLISVPQGSVARTLTSSLLSIETIPGARIKIPWNFSSVSVRFSSNAYMKIKR